MKLPSAEHPIAITPYAGRVVVSHAGQPIADSRNALALKEASYPVVYYIPRADIRMGQLAESAHTSVCPYKGEASYFNVAGAANAAWSYEAPHPAVSAIAAHIAFWTGRVDEITASPD